MLRRSIYSRFQTTYSSKPLLRTDIHPLIIRNLAHVNVNKSWLEHPVKVSLKTYDAKSHDINSLRGSWYLPSMQFLKLPYYYYEDHNKHTIESKGPSLMILGLDPYGNRNFYYLYHGYVSIYGNLFVNYDKLKILDLHIQY